MYSRSILFSWLSVVMPATSALVTRGERARLRALYLRSTRYVLATYAGVAVALVGFGAPFVRLWMGDGFETSYAVMCLLVAGNLVLSQNVVAHVMLPGMGELRVFTLLHGDLRGRRGRLRDDRHLRGRPRRARGRHRDDDARHGARVPRDGRADALRRALRALWMRCHWPVLKALAPVVAWIVAVRLVVPLGSWPRLASTAIAAGIVFLGAVWTFALTRAERRASRRLAAERGVADRAPPGARREAA
jgi:hypothetical protein